MATLCARDFASVDKIIKTPSYQKLSRMREILGYSNHDDKCGCLRHIKNELAIISRLMEVLPFDQYMISTVIPINVMDVAIKVKKVKVTIPITCTFDCWVNSKFAEFKYTSKWWKSDKLRRINYLLSSKCDRAGIKTMYLIYHRFLQRQAGDDSIIFHQDALELILETTYNNFC